MNKEANASYQHTNLTFTRAKQWMLMQSWTVSRLFLVLWWYEHHWNFLKLYFVLRKHFLNSPVESYRAAKYEETGKVPARRRDDGQGRVGLWAALVIVRWRGRRWETEHREQGQACVTHRHSEEVEQVVQHRLFHCNIHVAVVAQSGTKVNLQHNINSFCSFNF